MVCEQYWQSAPPVGTQMCSPLARLRGLRNRAAGLLVDLHVLAYQER